MKKRLPKWFVNAVMYEIYPQSFRDSNADGIGDFEGIISKLDYVKSLGVDGIWLNPCFDSPFRDAGYDVRDYRKTAARYGTNADLKRLFDEAHRRDIKVLLDLVPGHTSVEHPWFKAAVSGEKTPFDDYFVFTQGPDEDQDGRPFVCGYGERDGYYMTNFFYSQPALNYGFCDPKPGLTWQHPTDHPAALRVREEIRDIMKFWLDMGCDGYRVDLAFTLIKGRDEALRQKKLCELWNDLNSWMKEHYPEAVLIAEGGIPKLAYDCGFDSDFFLSWGTEALANRRTFRNETYEYRTNIRKADSPRSYFCPESSGNYRIFIDELEDILAHNGGEARFSIITGNHDVVRIRRGRGIEDLKVAYTFIFTMPGRPFLYYGDEIGMEHLAEVGNKEGAYSRGGNRSPMQWNKKLNAGFSEADAQDLYIMIDPNPERPCVEEQENDPGSLLNFTRKLIALRHQYPALGAEGAFRCLNSDRGEAPLVYERSDGAERFIVVINPGGTDAEKRLEERGTMELITSVGSVSVKSEKPGVIIEIGAVSAAIFSVKQAG